MTGSGGPVVYNPDFFMDKVLHRFPPSCYSQGVVHVGVNYRLGALGFLALPGEVGGNQGLRDQVRKLSSTLKFFFYLELCIILGAREHKSIRWRPWSSDNLRRVFRQQQRLPPLCLGSKTNLSYIIQGKPLSAGLAHRAIAQSGGNLGPGDNNVLHPLFVVLFQEWRTTHAVRREPGRWEEGWQKKLAALGSRERFCPAFR